MTGLDADGGRDFKGLDPREAQEALAEELTCDRKETGVDNDDDQDGVLSPAVEWSAEEIAEHMRMAEALLFAAAEPLDEDSIADRLPAGADIARIVAQLAAEYETRGVTLKKIGKKWRFVTSPDVAHVLEKEKITSRRLSRAALETLAIIAYHQPCSRADIEDVRGVQVAKGSLDQLLEIGWVRMRGKRRAAPGRPILFGTTESFLEQFGLESVEDLPGLADLKAAGLLDARLPPGFSVPSPDDAGDDDADDEGEETQFAQDFLSDEDGETADA